MEHFLNNKPNQPMYVEAVGLVMCWEYMIFSVPVRDHKDSFPGSFRL